MFEKLYYLYLLYISTLFIHFVMVAVHKWHTSPKDVLILCCLMDSSTTYCNWCAKFRLISINVRVPQSLNFQVNEMDWSADVFCVFKVETICFGEEIMGSTASTWWQHWNAVSSWWECKAFWLCISIFWHRPVYFTVFCSAVKSLYNITFCCGFTLKKDFGNHLMAW